MDFSEFDTGSSLEDVQLKLRNIVDHYTEIINTSQSPLYYLCFDISIAFVPNSKETGYTIDPLWAKGVYKAAKVDYRVFERLAAIVAENVRLGKSLPPELRQFASEMILDGSKRPRRNRASNGPSKLRDLCVGECMMLLTDKLNMYSKSEAKKPSHQASVLVQEAFTHAVFKVENLAKPRAYRVSEIWKGNKQKKVLRHDVSMLRWLEKNEKSNRWYRYFKFLYWTNRYFFEPNL